MLGRRGLAVARAARPARRRGAWTTRWWSDERSPGSHRPLARTAGAAAGWARCSAAEGEPSFGQPDPPGVVGPGGRGGGHM